MDIRPLLQITTVLLAAGALAYYGYGGWDEQQAVALDDPRQPDYLIDGVEAWQTDANGRLTRHFTGRQLVHRPQPEQFRVSGPVLTLLDQGRPLWQVTAREALSSNPATDIWLQGNVVALRGAHAGPPLRIETARLHANPRGNQIISPERVTVSGPQGRLQGVGLSTDLNAKSLQLHSAVEVTYAASK